MVCKSFADVVLFEAEKLTGKKARNSVPGTRRDKRDRNN